MASISDKLKAVVMGGVITAASTLSPGMAAAADNNQQAKAAPAATQTTAVPRLFHQRGTTPGSFENLFRNPEVRKQLPDAFWENGKKFAEIVKQNAAKGNFWNMPVYEGVPPIAQFMPGYPKTPIPGGALNIKQFAEYLDFVALNGDPRLTAAGKPNAIFPRVIVGVVTPDNSLDPRWRKRMADAKKEAVEIEQKFGASHGAAVYEIVRVIADDDDTIFVEAMEEGKGKSVPLKDAVIVTVPGRTVPFISYNMLQLGVHLEKVFTENRHVKTNRELYCESDLGWEETEACAPASAQKGVAGRASSGAKDKGGAGGGKGAAGSGKVAAADGPTL